MTDVTHRLSAEGADPLALAGVNDRNLQELERMTGVRVSVRGDQVTLAGAGEAVVAARFSAEREPSGPAVRALLPPGGVQRTRGRPARRSSGSEH